MIPPRDREILRRLAGRVAEIAALPEMAERRRLWCRHNMLRPERPMILVFPEGAWIELIPPDSLTCEDAAARGMELELRRRIYGFEQFHSDNVVEAEWLVHKVVHNSGWGLPTQRTASTVERGAWAFDPVLRDPADLARIQAPQIAHDPDATARRLAEAEELFGDLLTVRLVGVNHVSFHLMNLYTGWRGYEQVMEDMVVAPETVHEAMSRLEAGYAGLVRQYLEQDLLDLNHDNTYHSSGGVGYTEELPRPAPGDPVRPEMLWASAESQEMAPVSPAMHAEFVMPYERRLLAPFGLTGYGCCEQLHDRMDEVLRFPGIRRVSISPFCDVARAAEQLQDRCIFSWKPQPADLVGRFDPDRVRAYLQHTLDVTRGGVVEMILKDTHTCQHQGVRFTAWTRIARDLAG